MSSFPQDSAANGQCCREGKSEEREGGKEKEIKKGRVERGNFVPASWRESGRKK